MCLIIWRRTDSKTCKQAIMSAKNYSNVNKKLWQPHRRKRLPGEGWWCRNYFPGGNIRMESWELHRSLLSNWDREVQRGTWQLNWGIEICPELQSKAWNYKRRPRYEHACKEHSAEWGATEWTSVGQLERTFGVHLALPYSWGTALTNPLNESSHLLMRPQDLISPTSVVGLAVEGWPAVDQSQDLSSPALANDEGLDK